MGGVPCFVGTRVPFRTLIDYLVIAETSIAARDSA
jgi:uncharacterized protein (DUF433 family)